MSIVWTKEGAIVLYHPISKSGYYSWILIHFKKKGAYSRSALTMSKMMAVFIKEAMKTLVIIPLANSDLVSYPTIPNSLMFKVRITMFATDTNTDTNVLRANPVYLSTRYVLHNG